MGGLMSLLEGHGDVTMDRAGAARIPSAKRFAAVLRERRRAASPSVRLLQRLIGLEAKLNQYEQGERFIAEVERLAGPDAVELAWRGPDLVPTLHEIRSPSSWLTRVHATAQLAG
jgi:putative hydrolase